MVVKPFCGFAWRRAVACLWKWLSRTDYTECSDAGRTIRDWQAGEAAVIQLVPYDRTDFISADRGPHVLLVDRLRRAPAQVEGSHGEPVADLPGGARDLRQDRSRADHGRGP